MYRSITTNAIVIRRERMGEYNKNLVLLTSDLGLLSVTAFGAYKMQSRVRMGSEPFTHSRFSLYHNPVKGSYKVTEVDVRESFEGLRRDLDRIAIASLWAEVALKSFGLGETSGTLYDLLVCALRFLDSCSQDDRDYAAIQFLWRFLFLAGCQPDTSACDSCGRHLKEEAAAYEPASNAILCPRCARASSRPLTAGALRYLEVTEDLPFQSAAAVRLETGSFLALRACLTAAVQGVMESELKSLRALGPLAVSGRLPAEGPFAVSGRLPAGGPFAVSSETAAGRGPLT